MRRIIPEGNRMLFPDYVHDRMTKIIIKHGCEILFHPRWILYQVYSETNHISNYYRDHQKASMLTKHKKLIIVVVGLLLSCLLGIFGGIGIKSMSFQTENRTQHARRTILVTIDKSQWDELFIRLRKFADKWGYAIRIAPSTQVAIVSTLRCGDRTSR